MSDTVKAWIDERRTIHAKATPGEWWWEGKSDDDWPQSENSLMAGKEAVAIGWGYDASGINVEDDDATYITDALNMLPRALDALNKVLELHKPESRFTMYGYEDYSFSSVEEAHAFAGEPFEVEEFKLCAECRRVEDGADNNTMEIGYMTSEYPCLTVRALEGVIDGD